MFRPEILLLALSLCALPALARGGEPLTEAHAVERALAHHPALREAEAAVQTAAAVLRGAEPLLPTNPELSASAGPRTGGERSSTDLELALTQRVDLAGGRGLRIDAARAALRVAEARRAARRAEVTTEVRELLGSFAAAEAQVALAEESARLARQGVEAARKRHAAGDAARLELEGARLEAARTLRAGREAVRRREALRVELELLLALEPDERAEPSFPLAPPPGRPPRGLDELLPEVLPRRLDVAAARLELAAAEQEERLAARAAAPTPTLGVSWGREDGAQLLRGTLSVELPFFQRNQAERGAAAARLELARTALAAAERRATREVRLALDRVRGAREAFESLDEAAAAAAGSLDAVTRAWEAGQLDFTRWLLLRREAIDARRERIEALEELIRADARLALAVGD